MLLDSAGAVLGRNITDATGQYSVPYSRSARSIRVVRIGFQPREITFAAALDHQIDIALATFKTTLAAVQITEKSNCPVTSDRAAAFAFWDQARAALLNAVVARRANPMSVHRLYFQRSLSAEHDSITKFVVYEDYTRSSETSFTTARSASDLVKLGFTFSGDTNVVSYTYGPDEDALLDDAFANGYCFRFADPSPARPTQVGVAFAPAGFKRGRVDIAGTVWVDTAARVLRDVEFRYIGMSEVAERVRPGGTISFISAANGVTFISRYSLRLLGNAPDTVFTNCPYKCTHIIDHFFPTENGAEVSHAEWRGGLRWDAALGSASIRAVTREGAPAKGAVVELNETQYHATADTGGVEVIHDLLPGPYAVVVRDPRLASLKFLLPTVTFVAARDSTVRLDLTVPTVETYAAGGCKKSGQWRVTDSTYVFGRVLDADNRPVAGVRVSYALQMNDTSHAATKGDFTTGGDGVFQFCGADFVPGRKLELSTSRSGYWNASAKPRIKDNTTIVPIRVEVHP